MWEEEGYKKQRSYTEEKKTISREKDAPKVMCRDSAEKNKNRQKSMNNKVNKSVSRAITEKTDVWLIELKNSPNGNFILIKIDSKEIEC